MIRIILYRNKCIGCHACVEAAPHRWRISRRDGKTILIDATAKRGIYTASVSRDELEENQRAAAHCPLRIIRVEA